MRARNIKPAFFCNELLAECSPHARLLFVGLWCLADRDGKLEERPKRIVAELFPYEQVKIDNLLRELASRGFIERYTVDGEKYVSIPAFYLHQNPHPREKSMNFPDNPESRDKKRLSREKVRLSITESLQAANKKG